ncbi:MAG: hypothetical protein O3A10_03030 [Chloroflexi bacterium]|nr:hypothetical protein [Chloroflexota bacterium]MDA1145120.1 hypothetical protein [Chloroflexota bacterium]
MTTVAAECWGTTAAQSISSIEGMRHFDDTPDDSRPANPWPRLLALGAVILVAILASGACLVAFLNTGAEPELRLTIDEIEPGIPRFEPITNWGADDEQFTYGIWVAQIEGVGTRAYLSRDVGSGCHVQWLATARVGETVGLFRDRCSGSSYDIGGAVIDGPASRNLDQFSVTTPPGEVIVDFAVLLIGECHGAPTSDAPICSTELGTTTRTVPTSQRLPDDFATR